MKDLKETLSTQDSFALAVGAALESNRGLTAIKQLVPDAVALRELYEFAVDHGVDEDELSSLAWINRSDLVKPRADSKTYSVQKILERLEARL